MMGHQRGPTAVHLFAISLVLLRAAAQLACAARPDHRNEPITDAWKYLPETPGLRHSASSLNSRRLLVDEEEISSLELLKRAVKVANDGTCDEGLCSPVVVTLTNHVRLDSKLPDLGPGVQLVVQGACAIEGHPGIGRCEISGANRWPIFMDGGGCISLVLHNLILKDSFGGAYNGGCDLTVSGVVFENNIAQSGGAVKAAYSKGLKIAQSYFYDNEAKRGFGGAVQIGEPYSPANTASIFQSTFEGNEAIVSGGAIYGFAYHLVVRQSTFKGNRAHKGGGAISYSGFNGSLIENSFSNNKAPAGGAIELVLMDDNVGQMKATVCANSFAGNAGRLGMNIHGDRGPAMREWFGMELNMCPSRVPLSKLSGDKLEPRIDCSDCSGCPSNCNGNGDCQLSSFGEASCACINKFDPGYQCKLCNVGYALPTCTKCLPGFTELKPEGICILREGMREVLKLVRVLENSLAPGYANEDSRVVGATHEKDYLACQNKCEKFKGPELSPPLYSADPHCNFWAFHADDPDKPMDGGACHLYNYLLFCEEQSIRLVKDLGLYYQIYQLEPNFCP